MGDYRDERRKLTAVELSITTRRELQVLQRDMRRSMASLVRQAIEEFCSRHGAPDMAERDADYYFEKSIWIRGGNR